MVERAWYAVAASTVNVVVCSIEVCNARHIRMSMAFPRENGASPALVAGGTNASAGANIDLIVRVSLAHTYFTSIAEPHRIYNILSIR